MQKRLPKKNMRRFKTRIFFGRHPSLLFLKRFVIFFNWAKVPKTRHACASNFEIQIKSFEASM